jgi:hypothetical protein
VKRFVCAFRGHDWRSTFVIRVLPNLVGLAPGRIYPFEIDCAPRDLYVNECRRCGETTGPMAPLGDRGIPAWSA